MSTAAWNLAQLRKRRKPSRAFCELDGWSFDPRYTEGRCPICGWVAPGAPEAPWWMILARRFEWDMAGLVLLLAVLALAAVAVLHAAGYTVPGLGPVHAAPATIASPARTSASPSSSSHASPKATASPKASSSPSGTP